MASLISVVDIYATKLSFDVSCRVGMPENLKEEAKQLLEQGGIKKNTYDKLLRLELVGKDNKDENKDKKMNITFSSSGFAIDPRKSNMAI